MKKTETLSNPSPEDAANFIINGHCSDQMILLCCTCDVEYDGRAESYLPVGDRLVLIKADGVFLVHGVDKWKPRNWQPSNATLDIDVEDDTLVLRSTRPTPQETLTVYCETIYELTCFDATDDADLALTGTETDMHERIMATPSIIEPGFTALEHEMAVEYGSIDIYGEDQTGIPVVVEVKRRRTQLKDVDQLQRYRDLHRAVDPRVRGILVAPSASESVLAALTENGLEYVAMQPEVADEKDGC